MRSSCAWDQALAMSHCKVRAQCPSISVPSFEAKQTPRTCAVPLQLHGLVGQRVWTPGALGVLLCVVPCCCLLCLCSPFPLMRCVLHHWHWLTPPVHGSASLPILGPWVV